MAVTQPRHFTAVPMLIISVVLTAVALAVAWAIAFGASFAGWAQLTIADMVSVVSLVCSLLGSLSAYLVFASGAGRIDVGGVFAGPWAKLTLLVGGAAGVICLFGSLSFLLLRNLVWYYVWLVCYSLVFIVWDCVLYGADKSKPESDKEVGEIKSRLRKWLWFTDVPCFLSSASVLVIVAPLMRSLIPSLGTPSAEFVRGLSTGVSLSQFMFVGLFLFLGVYQDSCQDRGQETPSLLKV